MKIITGNLLDRAFGGEYDLIIQGCNCFNTMGSGLAKDIKKYCNEAYEADLKTKKGDRNKLGTFSKAEIKRDDVSFVVINAYTQYFYGNKGVDLFEYECFEKVLKTLNNEFAGKKIGLPLIGCGLAGGNKDRIMGIIEKELTNLNYEVVEFNSLKPKFGFK